jgi:HSP20 family protein
MPKAMDQHVQETFLYLSQASQNTWTPNTDVYETPDVLVVKMELAGVEENDVTVTVEGRLLVVRGVRHDPCRQKRCSFQQVEIDYGPFERRVLLARPVAGDRIEVRLSHGLLTVQLPKAS